MIGKQDIDRVMGTTAYDPDGDKIGDVDTVFVDDDTGEPTFALVNTGLFGTRSSFVPLTDAEVTADGDLRVAHTKDKVKDAPNVEADEHLSPSEEAELYRYYDIEYPGAPADTGPTETTAPIDPAAGIRPPGGPTAGTTPQTGTGDAPGTVGHDTRGQETDDAMTRSEEEVRIGKDRREIGRVRLRKHVVTDHVTKTVPVEREEVRVEREPVTDANADRATSGPQLSEDEHEVVVHEEEPVVEKRTVPKERVRLDKDVVTDEETVDEDVRREEIDIAGAEQSREPRR